MCELLQLQALTSEEVDDGFSVSYGRSKPWNELVIFDHMTEIMAQITLKSGRGLCF